MNIRGIRCGGPILLALWLGACSERTGAPDTVAADTVKDSAPAAASADPDADPQNPAQTTPETQRMVMHYDPGCGCCGDWAEYMREQGFELELRQSANITAQRRELGVPDHLASCHTVEIGGYLIEGHVPASAVRRLLEERPDALGISAPGMPIGSPGMEVGGRVDEYPVALFDADGNSRVFARYHGHDLLEPAAHDAPQGSR